MQLRLTFKPLSTTMFVSNIVLFGYIVYRRQILTSIDGPRIEKKCFIIFADPYKLFK